jgi:GT2 family glycosyltransferase
VINIGIGVCSYKRPELATGTCKSILNTIDKSKYNITTICSVDDTDITGYDWIASNFDDLLYAPNAGISVNKNRLLNYLDGNDYIFLIEDDILLLKEGWLELYLKAIELTGYQHLNYIVSDYRSYIKETVKYGNITLGLSGPYVNGILMIITKKCIGIVGGFDERYKVYGYEHVDYTRRCRYAGLYPKESHVHIMEASPYVDFLPSKSCLSDDDKKKYIALNAPIYNAPINTVYNGSFKKAVYECLT